MVKNLFQNLLVLFSLFLSIVAIASTIAVFYTFNSRLNDLQNNIAGLRAYEIQQLLSDVSSLKINLQSEIKQLENSSYGVVWVYGKEHQIGGVMQKLIHPRYAEETPNETVLISDYEGNRVIEVEKATKNVIWQYSIGLSGPNSAHRLANGGTLICDGVNDRVIEVNSLGEIVWSYTVDGPYDAVKIEDTDYMLITGGFFTGNSFICKIKCSDKSQVWQKDTGDENPTSIFVIKEQHMGKPAFNGGDYIITFQKGYVRELKDSDQSYTWIYGSGSAYHAYKNVAWMSGACIGWSDVNTFLLFMSEPEYGRVFAINKEGHTVWAYGWSYNRFRPSPLLNTPDSVRLTKQGNLLIADSGGSKVVELQIKYYKIPREFADLADFQIRSKDTWFSRVAETGWYPWNYFIITVENSLDQDALVQVQTSRTPDFWSSEFVVDVGSPVTVPAGQTKEILIQRPILNVRLKSNCNAAPTTGTLNARIDMFEKG